MELRLKTGSVPVVYLTGKTFDHFDGSEWSKTYESSLNDALIDHLRGDGRPLQLGSVKGAHFAFRLFLAAAYELIGLFVVEGFAPYH